MGYIFKEIGYIFKNETFKKKKSMGKHFSCQGQYKAKIDEMMEYEWV